jgi:hypothetical protein
LTEGVIIYVKEERMKQQQRLKRLPSECKMPDLSDSYPPLKGLLIVQFLVGEKGLSKNARLYRRSFIRLLDKSVEEHGKAREAILAQIEEGKRPPEEMAKRGRGIYMFTFTDHIETCINAVARLFKLLDRIKSEPESPAFPRETRKLVETKSESITDIRNVVEHMDELIQKDEIAPGEAIMPALSENDESVVVSNKEIKFEEIAMVLRKMHEIAQYILTVKKLET